MRMSVGMVDQSFEHYESLNERPAEFDGQSFEAWVPLRGRSYQLLQGVVRAMIYPHRRARGYFVDEVFRLRRSAGCEADRRSA